MAVESEFFSEQARCVLVPVLSARQPRVVPAWCRYGPVCSVFRMDIGRALFLASSWHRWLYLEAGITQKPRWLCHALSDILFGVLG